MVDTNEALPNSDKESVELTKTTKGYTWSIKIKENFMTVESLTRLNGLNAELKAKYGEQI